MDLAAPPEESHAVKTMFPIRRTWRAIGACLTSRSFRRTQAPFLVIERGSACDD